MIGLLPQQRLQAAKKGEKRYMPKNKPCKKHGKVERFVSNDCCVICTKERAKQRYAEMKKFIELMRKEGDNEIAKY